jgi:hypothetical protein
MSRGEGFNDNVTDMTATQLFMALAKSSKEANRPGSGRTPGPIKPSLHRLAPTQEISVGRDGRSHALMIPYRHEVRKGWPVATGAQT